MWKQDMKLFSVHQQVSNHCQLSVSASGLKLKLFPAERLQTSATNHLSVQRTSISVNRVQSFSSQTAGNYFSSVSLNLFNSLGLKMTLFLSQFVFVSMKLFPKLWWWKTPSEQAQTFCAVSEEAGNKNFFLDIFYYK